jgi:hypothetical protein
MKLLFDLISEPGSLFALGVGFVFLSNQVRRKKSC